MSNSISDSLSTNYMLAKLTIRKLGDNRTDHKLSSEVAANHGADESWGDAVKKLFGKTCPELNACRSAYDRLRTWFYQNSLPWSDAALSQAHRGPRLVSTLDMMRLLTEFDELHQAAKAARQAFIDVYPQALQERAAKLNTIFDPDDYPSVQNISSMFGATLDFNTLPSGTDFHRTTIPTDIAVGLEQQLERKATTQVENAMREVHEKTAIALGRMIEAMNKQAKEATHTDKNGKARKPRLYQSMLGNLKHMSNMLRTMNITNDPVLMAAADDIDNKLLQYELDDFRDNPALCSNVAKEARTIHAAIKSQLGNSIPTVASEAEATTDAAATVEEPELAPVDDAGSEQHGSVEAEGIQHDRDGNGVDTVVRGNTMPSTTNIPDEAIDQAIDDALNQW